MGRICKRPEKGPIGKAYVITIKKLEMEKPEERSRLKHRGHNYKRVIPRTPITGLKIRDPFLH